MAQQPDPDNPSETQDTDMLLAYLRTHEAACPLCGYNLHQLTRNVCPECGQPLELRVGAVGARIGALCACLTPLLMMSGVAVPFIYVLARFGLPPRREYWVWVVVILGVINAGLALGLYALRPWFFRLGIGIQNLLVLAAWFANPLVLVVAIYGR